MSNSNMSYKFSILLLLSVACFVFVLSETTFDDRVESLPGYGAFPEEEVCIPNTQLFQLTHSL